MTDPHAWVITRAQLIDAIANIKVGGTLLPGRLDPVVVADDMADAILGQMPAPDAVTDLPAAVITAEMVAAAHDYDIAHRDDPGQPVRGRWWRPPDDQVRRLLTGAAPHITAAQRVWRRGADGRWPDGHKCGGCTGPDSELCDCCADACECVEPSLAIVQAVAAATAAERQRIRQLAEQHKAHTWTQHVNHDNPGDSYWAEEPFAELLREDTP